MQPEAAALVFAQRYRVGSLLGRGAVGDVYDGEDLRLHRPVAVKVLRPEMAASATARRRFEEEARAAARIAHPNVVAVFDTGEHDGSAFIIMERLPGRTLADEMHDGPLVPARACEIAMQVLAALGAAHDEGVVHRDIKPGNILLTDQGQAKVADFGIAKVAEGSDITATGTLVGTPAYLAPERVAGEPATAASDLYAVGVVLYEALAGAKPFQGDTPVALAHAIHADEARPLGEVRPDVRPEISAAVQRAMSKDPAERFPTARAMLDALRTTPGEATVASQPAPAGDETVADVPRADPKRPRTEVLTAVPAPVPDEATQPLDRARRWAGANRGALVAIGAAAVGLIVLAAALSGTDGDPPAEPSATTEAPSEEPQASLPPALDDAIDQLEESIQP